MPIYEYHCKNCEVTFEVMKSFSSYKKTEKCPTCKKNSVRHFAGNKVCLNFVGKWYKTGGY